MPQQMTYQYKIDPECGHWYYIDANNRAQKGPFSREAIQMLAAKMKIGPETEIVTDFGAVIRADQLPGMLFPTTPLTDAEWERLVTKIHQKPLGQEDRSLLWSIWLLEILALLDFLVMIATPLIFLVAYCGGYSEVADMPFFLMILVGCLMNMVLFLGLAALLRLFMRIDNNVSRMSKVLESQSKRGEHRCEN
ncbi:MAG: GYF domain-containing protein [Thermoguttaceae bacterium]